MVPNAQRFHDKVDSYARSRPKYPAAVLRFLQSELGLSPTHAVADVGSGTGFFAELFVRNGNAVYCVEPGERMRQSAEESLGMWPNFHSVVGTAEGTTLPDASIEFVTAAQAYHWFDPDKSRAEFRRILCPGGWVVLVWNMLRVKSDAMTRGYDSLLEKYQPGRPVSDPDEAPEDAKEPMEFFGRGNYSVRLFENPQQLTRDGFLDRLTSSSYTPPSSHENHQPLMSARASYLTRTSQTEPCTCSTTRTCISGVCDRLKK